MSRLSARSGVMYSAEIPSRGGSPGASRASTIASKTGSIAVSVFPVPVGASTRAFRPAASGGIASRCGSVGVENPCSESAARTSLPRCANASIPDGSAMAVIVYGWALGRLSPSLCEIRTRRPPSSRFLAGGAARIGEPGQSARRSSTTNTLPVGSLSSTHTSPSYLSTSVLTR